MKKAKRRHEFVDSNPMTLPVKFQRPPTLAEQIARFMGANDRLQSMQGTESPEEAEDFTDEDDEPKSPHELVYDELINREIPRFEKELLDRGRAEFDSALAKKIREDRMAAAAAQKAAMRQKKSKKDESADADDEQ